MSHSPHETRNLPTRRPMGDTTINPPIYSPFKKCVDKFCGWRDGIQYRPDPRGSDIQTGHWTRLQDAMNEYRAVEQKRHLDRVADLAKYYKALEDDRDARSVRIARMEELVNELKPRLALLDQELADLRKQLKAVDDTVRVAIWRELRAPEAARRRTFESLESLRATLMQETDARALIIKHLNRAAADQLIEIELHQAHMTVYVRHFEQRLSNYHDSVIRTHRDGSVVEQRLADHGPRLVWPVDENS